MYTRFDFIKNIVMRRDQPSNWTLDSSWWTRLTSLNVGLLVGKGIVLMRESSTRGNKKCVVYHQGLAHTYTYILLLIFITVMHSNTFSEPAKFTVKKWVTFFDLTPRTFLKGRLFPSKEHCFVISRCPDKDPVGLFHVLWPRLQEILNLLLWKQQQKRQW